MTNDRKASAQALADRLSPPTTPPDGDRKARERERKRLWREANAAKIKEQARLYRERRRVVQKAWRDNNPDKVGAQAERYKARPGYKDIKRGQRQRYKARHREQQRNWYQEYYRRPDVIARKRAYFRRPEVSARRSAYDKARWQRAKSNRWVAIGEAFQTALRKNDLYAAAAASVPTYYPRHTRDDIISTIVLAVLEGDFSIEQIPHHAKRVISVHYKESHYHGTISLDAPAHRDGGLDTIGDNVSEGMWS